MPGFTRDSPSVTRRPTERTAVPTSPPDADTRAQWTARPRGDIVERVKARIRAEHGEHALRAAARFRLLTPTQLAAIAPPPPLVHGLLFRAGFSAIVAPYDSYKSFVALSLALSIGSGLDWFGHDVARGLVIYQAAEG